MRTQDWWQALQSRWSAKDRLKWLNLRLQQSVSSRLLRSPVNEWYPSICKAETRPYQCRKGKICGCPASILTLCLVWQMSNSPLRIRTPRADANTAKRIGARLLEWQFCLTNRNSIRSGSLHGRISRRADLSDSSGSKRNRIATHFLLSTNKKSTQDSTLQEALTRTPKLSWVQPPKKVICCSWRAKENKPIKSSILTMRW